MNLQFAGKLAAGSVLLVTALVTLAVCSSRSPATTPSVVQVPSETGSSALSSTAPNDDVATVPAQAPEQPSEPESPPLLLDNGGCACAPCEPIKSQDPCTSAADCAPSALCHAPACIAKAKAPVAPDGGVMCTMRLACKTVDVGRCDCVDGVCALVAK